MEPNIVILVSIAIFLTLGLLYLFSKPGSWKRLHPLGGPRIKTILAWLLIKSGSKTKENKLGFEHANKRVPPLPGKPFTDYNDSFVFLGIDGKGNLIMTRIGFREEGREKETWVWMIIDGKRYSIPVDYITETNDDGKTITGNGISYECTDSEKGIWEISYSGKLDPEDLDCSFTFTYTPVSQMYHSGIVMDFKGFARAMSEMPWSKEYFKKLSSENQTRIEQGGTFNGELTLGGNTRQMEMLGIRDHSWGKRNWNFITRYIWNVIALESPLVINNREYRYVVYTVADYGTTFNHIVAGWIAGPQSILPISRCSNMKDLADNGVIPEHYSFSFQPESAPVQTMRVHRTQPEYSWIMQDDTFEVCEAWCSVEIGGVKGFGMSEFGYTLVKDPYGRKK